MRVLAVEREVSGVDPVRLQGHLRDEALALWTLTRSDVLRNIWFTQTGRRAVLMLECADLDQALDALLSLPLYRDGLIDFEVAALRPYDGFERLFDAGTVTRGH